jgi:hypothetical protein
MQEWCRRALREYDLPPDSRLSCWETNDPNGSLMVVLVAVLPDGQYLQVHALIAQQELARQTDCGIEMVLRVVSELGLTMRQRLDVEDDPSDLVVHHLLDEAD